MDDEVDEEIFASFVAAVMGVDDGVEEDEGRPDAAFADTELTRMAAVVEEIGDAQVDAAIRRVADSSDLQ
jgi:hypothetical protein